MPHQDDPTHSDEQAPGSEPAEGQVSEVAAFEPETDEPSPASPEDAVAGYPESESGAPQEGTAGPDAPPRHGRPEESNESSR